MKNEYGLDDHYFGKKLKAVVRDIKHYTPSEMINELKNAVGSCRKTRNWKTIGSLPGSNFEQIISLQSFNSSKKVYSIFLSHYFRVHYKKSN